MDLLEGFFKFLKTQQLIAKDSGTVLLAVSGGVDSVVMTHLFHKAGLSFAVAHCNFQLRGAESDEDEAFVEKLALNFEAAFFVKRFETKDYAHKNGVSTQMAARELRYAWFAQIAEENGFSAIATAHHQNDSIETALLNFARGTGHAGLTGIAPISGKLIRPLLFATRTEILDFSRQHEIGWRNDSSNDSDEYARNFVRRQIIPRFEDLNPSFGRTAARNMERIEEAAENLNFLLDHWFQPDQSSTDLQFSIGRLLQLPSPRQALRHILKPMGFDAEQARQLAENLDQTGFEIKSDKGYAVLVNRDRLLIAAPENHEALRLALASIHEDDLMVRLPDGTQMFVMEAHEIPASADPSSIAVDHSKLVFPLHLRHWAPGDVFQPFGMEGKSQKLQDFFTNHKVNRFEKDKVWLLTNGDGALIWVVGMRLDHRFRTQDKTSKILKFNWVT